MEIAGCIQSGADDLKGLYAFLDCEPFVLFRAEITVREGLWDTANKTRTHLNGVRFGVTNRGNSYYEV